MTTPGDGEMSTAADLLLDILGHTKETIVGLDEYPEIVLGERDAPRITPWVQEALKAYDKAVIQHIVLWTVNYLHATRSTYFFTPLGTELLAFAPWLGLRLFMLGVNIGQQRAASGFMPDGAFTWPSEEQFLERLVEMYGRMPVFIVPHEEGEGDDTPVVESVENPFTEEE